MTFNPIKFIKNWKEERDFTRACQEEADAYYNGEHPSTRSKQMIAHTPEGKVTITKENGQDVARGESCIGYGRTPSEALKDWKAACKWLDEIVAATSH